MVNETTSAPLTTHTTYTEENLSHKTMPREAFEPTILVSEW